ncbi:MAG TPA: PA14 domain-containing protein [Pyrinomonadaceae bacterium]|nr:PA14 domain-containing protein [Pyrinomonadaceae bacterium]
MRRYARLIDAFGEQATYGARQWFGRVGSRFAGIDLLGKGEGGGVLKAYYASGREIPEFDSAGARNWQYHTSDDGVESGPPELIPGLPGFRPAGRSWVEWLLPLELSEGTDEPEPILWIINALKVHDYEISGSSLVRLPTKIVSANNALVALFIATERQGMPLARFNRWRQSWMGFKARCPGVIPFEAGTGLLGQYYADGTLTALAHTRNEPYLDRDWDYVSPAPDVPAAPFSARFTGKVKPPHAGAWTFYARYDDACRLWVNGVQLVNDWAGGGMRESSGTVTLAANTEYNIVVEYRQDETLGGLHLSWSHASVPKEIVPQSRLIPPSRPVERYNAHMAFAPGTPAPAAFRAVFRRAPGVSWQDVNGAIRVLTTPDRAVTFPLTYDLTQTAKRTNILDRSFSLTPLAREGRPDYLIVPYDDLDDPFFSTRSVAADRREDPTKPPKNPLTLPHIGVATHSLASRIAETEMNVLHALSYFVNLGSFADAHKAAKCDVITYSHEVSGVRESSPFKLFITKETFLSPNQTADARAFVGRSHVDDWYSDDAHAVLPQRVVSDIPHWSVPPPPAEAVTLLKFDRFTPDDTHVPYIHGTVRFAPFAHPQRGRVYWKRPRKAFTFDPATDAFTAASHGYPAGAKVELFTAGALPAGFAAGTPYYVVSAAQNTFKLALTQGGSPVNGTSAGSGVNEVREFDFAAQNILVTPDPVTREGTFEVENTPLGANDFKIVTESLKGVSRGLEGADTYSFTVLPLPPPANVAGLAVESASRAGVQLRWDANAEWDVRAYRVQRFKVQGGVTGWHDVTTVDSNSWFDPQIPDLVDGLGNPTTAWRVKALARGRRESVDWVSVTFSRAIYGNPTPQIGAITARVGSINVPVTLPNASDSGRRSVRRTTVVVAYDTVDQWGELASIELARSDLDGLNENVVVALNLQPGGVPAGLYVAAEVELPVTPSSPSVVQPLSVFPLIQPADLPSATSSIKGAVMLSQAMTPSAHAASHKHGGGDEVATATPAANAIPKAGSDGKLASGWLPASSGVSGSGTSGKLAKFTGTNTLGDSAVTESGGNVGIGVTPNSKFQIGSDIQGAAQVKTVAVNDTTTTDFANLAHYNSSQATARPGIIVSNSAGAAEWSNNYMVLFAHGHTYAHNFFLTDLPGKTGDAGWSVLAGLGNNTYNNGFLILTYNARPLVLGANNQSAIEIGTTARVKFLKGVAQGGGVKHKRQTFTLAAQSTQTYQVDFDAPFADGNYTCQVSTELPPGPPHKGGFVGVMEWGKNSNFQGTGIYIRMFNDLPTPQTIIIHVIAFHD